MEIASSLVYNVGLLFLMLIPGILLKKCHLATEGLGKGLANLVLYIAQPAMIVLAYIRPYDEAILRNAIYVLIFSAVSHVIFIGAVLLCFRNTPQGKQCVLRFATVFSNAAYMGMPLIVAALGSEAAIYASIYNITFNLFLWSFGVYLFTGDKRQTSLWRVLFHPVTISAAIGLLLFLSPIDGYVPPIVSEALLMLQNLVAPLSMIVIGMRLADMKLRGTFTDKNLYLFLFLRLLLLPVLIYGIMRLCMVCGLPLSKTVLTVVLVTASTPAATATSMFAEKFEGDSTYAGKLVAISTILSVLTMPLISLLLQL